MPHRPRTCFVTCAIALAILVAVFLGEWRDPSPHDDLAADTLTLATTVEPVSLHPVFAADRMSAVEILGALFEPLTVYDDQHQLIPCLATEVPTEANRGLRLLSGAEAEARGGKMESIWHLRSNARWSDGVPVTAHDFIFTCDLIKHADVPAISREVENRIVRMESHDDGRTLVVLWKEPYAFAQEGHRHLVVPRHVEGAWFEGLTDKKEYERTPYNRNPVGNGPYQVSEWAFGRYLVLKRQPFWHGPTPSFERIVCRFIPEPETILANLDTGRLGAVSPVALDPELAMQFEHRACAHGNTNYDVVARPGLTWMHIDFNTENPLTADRRVRQALVFGLNRTGMCASLFPGLNCATDTWVPPVHSATFPPPGTVSPDLSRYDYDPREAVRRLKDAGWLPGPDGIRIKDDKALRLMLTYVAGEPLSERIAQMVREDWRALGVDLTLRPLDIKKLSETSAENRAYLGLSLYPWFMDPSADGITFWTTENIPTDEKPSGQNNCRWRHPRSDELLIRATATLDLKRRRELLWEHQRIWSDEMPAIPLFFQPEVSIRHRNLHGWRPTGTDTPVTWNCYAWHWAR
jgi:peptide/nickel transport system substrate-binding protein